MDQLVLGLMQTARRLNSLSVQCRATMNGPHQPRSGHKQNLGAESSDKLLRQTAVEGARHGRLRANMTVTKDHTCLLCVTEMSGRFVRADVIKFLQHWMVR